MTVLLKINNYMTALLESLSVLLESIDLEFGGRDPLLEQVRHGLTSSYGPGVYTCLCMHNFIVFSVGYIE